MERGWKSGRIENILVSLICVWMRGWKNEEVKKKICLVKNNVYINLPSCLY